MVKLIKVFNPFFSPILGHVFLSELLEISGFGSDAYGHGVMCVFRDDYDYDYVLSSLLPFFHHSSPSHFLSWNQYSMEPWTRMFRWKCPCSPWEAPKSWQLYSCPACSLADGSGSDKPMLQPFEPRLRNTCLPALGPLFGWASEDPSALVLPNPPGSVLDEDGFCPPIFCPLEAPTAPLQSCIHRLLLSSDLHWHIHFNVYAYNPRKILGMKKWPQFFTFCSEIANEEMDWFTCHDIFRGGIAFCAHDSCGNMGVISFRTIFSKPEIW